MKAKTMLGLIACASACVSLSAFANTTNGWFGVTVDGTKVTHVNVTTNGVGTVSLSKINLDDIEQDSALVLTPIPGSITNRTDDIYMIGASVVLNPCSTNDFKDVNVTGAKAGVVAGIDDNDATNYYGYAGSNWYKLTGATVVDPGDATAFHIVLNYRDNVASFNIGESDEWYGPYSMSEGGASSLANIKVWGTGSISSVTGAFEVAEAEYASKRYGSVAEAMAVAKKEAGSGTPSYDSIAVVNDQGVAESTTDPDANGLMPWQNKAMGVEPTAQVGLTKASTKQNANQITLAAALPDKEPGVEVKFNVYCNGSAEAIDGSPFDADDIRIPMGSPGEATYTISPVISTK